MNAWIQKHDLSAEEFTLSSPQEAIEILLTFDWATESQKQKEKEENDIENCPAGLGIVAQKGLFLHICPDEDFKCLVSFRYPKTTKILGILPRTFHHLNSAEEVTKVQATELIKLFFASQYSEIEEILK